MGLWDDLNAAPAVSADQVPLTKAPVADPQLFSQLEAAPVTKVKAPVQAAPIEYGADRVDHKIDVQDIDENRKAWLKQAKFVLPPDKFQRAFDVMTGQAPEQQEDNLFTKIVGGAAIGATVGGTGAGLVGMVGGPAVAATSATIGAAVGSGIGAIKGGFSKNMKMYFDEQGMPQPLKYGEKPPPGSKIESAFGISGGGDSEDDNPFTTLSKSFYNSFVNVGKLVPETADILYGLGTGKSSKFLTQINNMVDTMKLTESSAASEEMVKPDAFNSVADFMNGQNWNFTPQNFMALSGQVMGSLAEFVGGAALFRTVNVATKAGQEATIGERLLANAPWKNPKSWALASAINLDESVQAADNAGLTGLERYALGMITALGMGALEIGVGGQELRLAGKKIIAKGVAEEFATKLTAEGATEITGETIEQLWKATLKNGLGYINRAGKTAFKEGLGEATEEMSQELWSESLQQLYDKFTGYKGDGAAGSQGFGTHLFNPKSMQQLFINGLGGALGGVFGGAVRPEEQSKALSKLIYDHIQAGKVDDLQKELAISLSQGNINQQQYDLAKFKIGAYQRYDAETSDLEIKITPQQRREIFELSFQDENAKHAAAELETDIKTNGDTAIKQAKLKAFQKLSTGYVNRIADIISKPAGDKEAQPEPSTVLQDEAEIATDETEDEFQKALREARKNFKSRAVEPGIKEKKDAVVEAVKSGKEIAGTIERPIGARTRWTFKDEKGSTVDFYGHYDNITDEDLTATATLHHVAEKEGHQDVIEVRIGEKVIGHVRESTDAEFKQREIEKRQTAETFIPEEEAGSVVINSDYDSVEDADNGMELSVTRNVKAVYNRKTKAFHFYNSSGREITSRRQRKKYAQKLTPRTVKTWWNELADDEQKESVKSILSDYLNKLQGTGGAVDIDENAERSLRGWLMKQMKGVKFFGKAVQHDTTDANMKKWFLVKKAGGHAIDTFIDEEEKTAEGFGHFDEQDIINEMVDIINSYPNGITNKDIEAEEGANNPMTVLDQLEDDFLSLSGLDLSLSVDHLNTLTNEKEEEPEGKTEGRTEVPEAEGEPAATEEKRDYKVVDATPGEVTVKGRDWEDNAIDALDKAQKSMNDSINKMFGGKGSLRSGGPAELFQAAANAGFELAKGVLRVEKSVRKALQAAIDYIKSQVGDLWDELSPQEQKSVTDDMRKWLVAANELIQKAGRVESTDEDIQDLAEVFGLSLEEAKTLAIRYGERNRFDEIKKQVRRMIVDKDGVPVVPGYTEKQLFDAIRAYSQSGLIDEADVKGSYAKMPNKELGTHLASLPTADLIRLHNFHKSFVTLPHYHFMNKGADGFTMHLSNPEVNSNTLKTEFFTLFDNHQGEENISQKYLAALKDYHTRNNALYKKILAAYDYKLADHSMRTIGTTTMNLMNNLTGEKGAAKAASQKELERLEKLKTEIENKSGIRSALSDYINNDLKFMEDMTGVPADNWMALLKENQKGYPTYGDYLMSNMKYRATTILQHFVLNKATTYRSFVDLVRGTDAKSPSQLKTLAAIIARDSENTGLADSFDDVMGNRVDSSEMVSTLTLMAQDMIRASKEVPRLKNNPVIKKGTKMARIDGVKDIPTDGAANLKKMTPRDLRLMMISSFLNSGKADMAGAGNFFLFYDQQADSKLKPLFAVERKPAAAFTMSQLKDIGTEAEFKKEISVWKKEIEKFVKDKLMVLPEGYTADTLAREYVINYAYNKYWLDDYFRGDTKNVKGYRAQVKRKQASNGEQLNLKVKDGVGENHNVAILNDPQMLFQMTQEMGDLTDGQMIIMPWFNDAIKVSSGGIYGGIVKDSYFKTEDNGSNTYLKGNNVTLPAENQSFYLKYPSLKLLLEWARSHKIDRIAFSSTAKLIDKSLINEVKYDGVNLDKSSLPTEPKIYKADNRYMLIQQDLVNDGTPKKGELTSQILHIIKSLKSGEEIEQLLSRATHAAKQEFEREFNGLTEKEKKEWFLEQIPNNPRYLAIRQFLASNDSHLTDPAYRNLLNQIFASTVEKRILNIPVQKNISIHVQLPGNELKSARKEGSKVMHGEAVLPAGFQSQMAEGDLAMIIRVPSDELHSFSFHTAVDFFPEEMKNSIMIDSQAQKVAGLDNDADAAHVWIKFKDKDGKFINDADQWKGMINKVFDLIQTEFEKTENFDRITRPIDIAAVDPLIKQYKDQEEYLNKNFPSSMVTMFDANRQSSIVTGMSANGIKVRNYLAAHGGALKSPLLFPVYKNGKATGDSFVLQHFHHEKNESEGISANMGNNLNQSLDNPKLGNLVAMGKVAATSQIFDLVSALDPAIQQSLIDFMHHPVVQDYINLYNEAQSPTWKGKKDLFKVLAEQYNDGKPLDDEHPFNLPPWKKDELPDARTLSSNFIADKIEVLSYLQYLEYLSRDFNSLNAYINLNEKNIKSFPELIRALDITRKIENNKLNAINLTQGTVPIFDSNAVTRGKANLNLTTNYYLQDLMYSETAQDIMDSMKNSFAAAEGRVNKDGELLTRELSLEVLETFDKAFHEFLVTQAMDLTEPLTELQAKAKIIIDSLPKDSVIRDFLEVTITGQVQLKQRLWRKDAELAQLKDYQKAFADLPVQSKDTLLRYQIKQFGYTQSKKLGGFLTYMDVKTISKVSQNIAELQPLLDDLSQGSREAIQDQILLTNPLLIPEVDLVHDQGFELIKRGNKGYLPGSLYPKFVKQIENGKTIIYRRLSSAKGPVTLGPGTIINSYYKRGSQHNIEFERSKTSIYKPLKLDQDINYQRSSWEALASQDPETQKEIQEHLAKTFPEVKAFTNPAAFQEYIDTHYPGLEFDQEALGAEIGAAYWINPESAVQSSEIHEVLHKYWDLLPENDKTKQQLIKIFKSDYHAINALRESYKLSEGQAIDEAAVSDIAREAYRQAKISTASGITWNKFKEWAKQFFMRIKRTLWGKLSKEEYVSIMANDFWKNKARLNLAATRSNLVNYMKGEKKWFGMEKEMKELADKLELNDLKDIQAKHIQQLREKPIELEEGENYLLKMREIRFGPVKTEDVENLDTALDQSGPKRILKAMDIESFSEKFLGKTLSWFKEKGSNANVSEIEQSYANYVEELAQLQGIIDSHPTLESIYGMDNTAFLNLSTELNSMQHMQKLGDRTYQAVMETMGERYFDYVAAQHIRNSEAQEGYGENKVFTKAVYEMAFGDEIKDWTGMRTVMSGVFGTQVAPFHSPRDVRERTLQLWQHIRMSGEIDVKRIHNAIIPQLRTAVEKIKKKGGSLSDVIVARGGKEYFIQEHEQEYVSMSGPAVAELREFLELYGELMRAYSDIPITSKQFWAVPQINMDWPELIKNFGLSEAVFVKLTGENRFDNIHIKVGKTATTLKQAREKIESERKKGLIGSLAAAAKIRKLIAHARDLYENKDNILDDAGRIIYRDEQQKINPGASFFKTATTSQNREAAIVKYFHQQAFRHVFEPKIPTLKFFETYYDKNGNKKDNKSIIRQYVKQMNDFHLFNEAPDSRIGHKGDRLLEFFNTWTVWKFLGFNLVGGGFNLSAGLTQNMREIGIVATMKGLSRFRHGLRLTTNFDEGFIQNAIVEFMNDFGVVNISRDMEISPGAALAEKAKRIIFSPIAYTEYVNHGITIAGLLSDEEWKEYIDSKKEKRTLAISNDRIAWLINEASRIHGAYEPLTKRPVNMTTMGRTVMALKNWMPDVVLAHFQSEYTDMDDVVRKGIITSAAGKDMREVYKSVFLSPGSVKDKWNALPEIDKQNMGKMMREVVTMAALFMLMAAVRDDKDKTKKLARVIGDVGFVYDMNNWEFLLSSPLPVLKTAYDGVNFIKEMGKISVGQGSVYEKDGKYGKEGSYKAPILLMNSLPANRIIKSLFEQNQ